MNFDEFSNNRIINNSTVGYGTKIEQFTAIENCDIGEDCHIWRFSNLYGCEIGDQCMIGSLVEIQEDVIIGDNCRIQSHAFVSSLVEIRDDVFVSHGAKFINDLYPPSGGRSDWETTIVGDGVSIGTNVTVLPVEIGEEAIIGAGAVVVDDVPAGAVVVGNPAKIIRYKDGYDR